MYICGKGELPGSGLGYGKKNNNFMFHIKSNQVSDLQAAG